MPTPPKTSHAELVSIALALVEADGPEALTVSAVAQAAGVKPPSLYKHFADREALLKAVEIAVLDELEVVLRREMKGRTPKARLRSLADVYRRFANDKPRRYETIYSRNAFTDPELTAACLKSAQPLFEELKAAGVSEKRLLPLSRTLVAFLHGFVSMEIVNAFRLGGDLDSDFAESLETILREVG